MHTGWLWQGMFGVAIVAVFFSDSLHRRVPNRWLLWLLLGFVAALILSGPGHAFGLVPAGIAQALTPSWRPLSGAIGFTAGLLLFYPFWRLRVMGAGDVKLLAVLGLVLGWQGLCAVFMLGSVTAAVHALALTQWYGLALLRREWRKGPSGRRGIPYAAHLSAAALAWIFWLQEIWQAAEWRMA